MIDRNRRLLALVFVAAAQLVMAGCAAPAPDQFDQRGAITFVDGPDTSSGRQIEQLVNSWNAQRGYAEEVKFVEMPYASDQFRAQLRATAQDLANGDRSDHCYDVVTMDVIWMYEFARAGYIVPLDPREFELDGFLRRPVEAVTVDGKVWAVPQRTDAGLLYYRKDILDREGAVPPVTWNELIRQARTIAPKHGVDGYVSQFARYEGPTVNAMEAIWGNGGDVLAPDGRVVVDSLDAKAGISMLARGFETGWIPRSALGFNEEESREAFQQGSALFLRNWPYTYRLLANPNSRVSGSFDVTALPGPSVLGGWNLGVSSCSKHPKTAGDFIRFVTSESNQRRLFENAGFAPTIAELYNDADLLQRFPYLTELRSSIENSRSRPATPYYDDVSGMIQEHLTNALSNPLSADVMAESLAEQLATVTRRR